jgi:hypothetical protein
VTLTPRKDMPGVDAETGRLVAQLTLQASGQVLPVTAVISAHITSNEVTMEPRVLEFGDVSVQETAMATVTLTNHSALPRQVVNDERKQTNRQAKKKKRTNEIGMGVMMRWKVPKHWMGCFGYQGPVLFPTFPLLLLFFFSFTVFQFGFVGHPEFVSFQPNQGFGTLLPFETLEVHVLVSPVRAEYDNPVSLFFLSFKSSGKPVRNNCAICLFMLITFFFWHVRVCEQKVWPGCRVCGIVYSPLAGGRRQRARSAALRHCLLPAAAPFHQPGSFAASHFFSI